MTQSLTEVAGLIERVIRAVASTHSRSPILSHEEARSAIAATLTEAPEPLVEKVADFVDIENVLKLYRFQTEADRERAAEAMALYHVRHLAALSSITTTARCVENLRANDLTVSELLAERSRIEKLWDDMRSSDEEMGGGSPGEWMIERLDEIETAIKCIASQPSVEREKVLRACLKALSDDEQEYRRLHDLYGDGDMRTGRAWDVMRRSGDRARTALATPVVGVGDED